MHVNSQIVVLIIGVVALSGCYCYTAHVIATQYDNASLKCSYRDFDVELSLSNDA